MAAFSFPSFVETNDPARRGQPASELISFGPADRYMLRAYHTRWDAVTWFVYDVETLTSWGGPEVIRQEPTPEAAVAGLA